MKRFISALAAASVLMGGCLAAAADPDEEIKGGMIEITADMLISVDGEGITAEDVAGELLTIGDETEEELRDTVPLDISSYTVDFGETPPLLGSYRCFVSGTGVRGGITVYGSQDYTSFTLIGKAETTMGGEWNDIAVSGDTAYRYITVTSVEEDAETDDPNDTASSAVETTGDDEEEDEDQGTSTVGGNDGTVGDAAVNEPARAVKAMFNERLDEEIESEDDTVSAGGTHDVGAAGGLGFFGSKFPDCRGHWAEEIIVECTDKNYLDGYEDGNFRPDRAVSAAEFAKIYSAWNGNFYTVSNGYWAMPFIRGLMDDGVFAAGDFADYDAPMTREQCAKAIVNSLKAEYFPNDLDKYKEEIADFDDVTPGYEEYILKAYVSGIITGYEDGSFRPGGEVTRAEILTIIDRAVDPTERRIPASAQGAASGAAETQTYYTAAVQVRKSANANNMNFRLFGQNAQYMTEDDTVNGLKLVDEFQGAQGMAFLMRFDLTDIIERESELENISLIINRDSNGDMPLGLFMYEETISQTDWNDPSYMQSREGGATAGDNKAGYNAVCDNISALLPTWGDMENAVPQEEKTQPFAQAELDENDQYVFELSLDTLKENMDENDVVEFFATSVNYDRYGMDEDNKPRCFVAGAKAPQLCCKFSGGIPQGPVQLMPEDAVFIGGMLSLEESDGVQNISNFTKDQSIEYTFDCSSAGTYKMTMNYAANQGSGGGTAKINVNGTEVTHDFAQTGSWTSYVFEEIGEFELKAGENKLTISDELIPNTYLINIREIILEKVN